ncbi:MAG: hypothetical protein NOF05_11035 [Candidatus Accumulibacter phosphatis]|uniref:Uncharacterized protein n=1 Tax=Candidatus Accumulibacter phosphatis TaxID=327160 RepID=A0A5S4EIZ7_9PROT|nr:MULTISPECIES: hypothetical protein [Candidatus Accumulibacter]HNG04810.1 hypothetical protein [Nitrospira sp.]MBL8401060.1 hypothetical protein [Accumulibacter sp.]MCC2867037.1 hypothetical protein [Candidatus Accumulibacter phosphatis]MCQ1549333.1 hypothetical protein [Candidatus Accumulibacter phosphatis]TMQ75185.1 hypothetical protein ACCUM_1877 [Candidatus Accumulibacter phosphatis]
MATSRFDLLNVGADGAELEIEPSRMFSATSKLRQQGMSRIAAPMVGG